MAMMAAMVTDTASGQGPRQLVPRSRVVCEATNSGAGAVPGDDLPTRAPFGPVQFNLASEAPELSAERVEPGCPSPTYYDLKRPGCDDDNNKAAFFIDQGSVVIRDVDAWLDYCHDSIRDPNKVGNPPPAFINGLTKVGKSCVLNDILPARLRVHPQFGVNKPQEALVFKLNVADDLQPGKGYASMLHSLLLKVMRWLDRQNVPVGEAVWRAALSSTRDPHTPAGVMETTIMWLLQEVKAPAVMLIDEVQRFFMPVANDGSLDMSGATMARGFFKQLLTTSPRTMLWAVTGSCMATFWVNLAVIAPHGVSLLQSHRLINLPPSHDTLAMQRCWRALAEAYPSLSGADDLYPLAQDTTPAMMVHLVQGWVEQGCPADIRGYVRGHHTDRLLAEAARDWHCALQFLDPTQRVLVYHLASVTVGVNMGLLDRGLVGMLTPFTRPVRHGAHRRCLDSALHCEVILSLVTPDGELKQLARGVPAVGSLEELQAQRLLLQLGNVVVAASHDEWGEAWKELKNDLQVLGEALERRGVPLNEWPNQPWFKRVHQSQYNSQQGAAAAWNKLWEQHEQGERTLEVWEAVAQVSVMVHNCLRHEKAGGEVVPHDLIQSPRLPDLLFDKEDVGIVTSWPFAESVGRIPGVVGPILASDLLAVQQGRGGGGGASAGSSDQQWPMPFYRPSLSGVKISMPPR